MRALPLILALGLMLFAPRPAAADRAGDFAYYVLSLSWSPTWCALEGRSRGAAQCAPGAGHGWVLHGLWPQHRRGWPAYCDTPHRAPSRAMVRGMADIMGSTTLARHQWRKHGTCSGLSARAYFDLSRRAYAAVVRPAVLRKLDSPVTLPAAVVEAAFLRANPGWQAAMLTTTCRRGRIQEARLCLTKDLAPRPCGPDVARDCALQDALLAPVR